MTIFPWEPERLVRYRDADGRDLIVEQELACPEAKRFEAEAWRKRLGAHHLLTRRAMYEADLFEAWASRQTGRPPNEVTFGNCMHELGLMRPSEVTPEEEAALSSFKGGFINAVREGHWPLPKPPLAHDDGPYSDEGGAAL